MNNRTTWVDTWVDFGGQHIAHYENNETYFVHSGRLGTAGIVTDYSGAVIQDELHYPWGQEWTSAGTITEERFASLNHRDSATNLDPTHFRMYSSDQGRWLTPDPAQADIYSPQSMSRYGYVTGNPANGVDPRGLYLYKDPYCCGGGISGGDPFAYSDVPVEVQTGYGFIPVGVNTPGPSFTGQVATGSFSATSTLTSFGYIGATYSVIGNGAVFLSQFGANGISPGGGYTPGPPAPPQLPSCSSLWLQSAAQVLGFSVPQLDEALQRTVQGASFWAMLQASAYAASRGLVSPFRSSIYRNWWALGEDLGFAAEVIPLGEAVAAAGYADFKVGEARARGQCRPGF